MSSNPAQPSPNVVQPEPHSKTEPPKPDSPKVDPAPTSAAPTKPDPATNPAMVVYPIPAESSKPAEESGKLTKTVSFTGNADSNDPNAPTDPVKAEPAKPTDSAGADGSAKPSEEKGNGAAKKAEKPKGLTSPSTGKRPPVSSRLTKPSAGEADKKVPRKPVSKQASRGAISDSEDTRQRRMAIRSQGEAAKVRSGSIARSKNAEEKFLDRQWKKKVTKEDYNQLLKKITQLEKEKEHLTVRLKERDSQVQKLQHESRRKEDELGLVKQRLFHTENQVTTSALKAQEAKQTLEQLKEKSKEELMQRQRAIVALKGLGGLGGPADDMDLRASFGKKRADDRSPSNAGAGGTFMTLGDDPLADNEFSGGENGAATRRKKAESANSAEGVEGGGDQQLPTPQGAETGNPRDSAIVHSLASSPANPSEGAVVPGTKPPKNPKPQEAFVRRRIPADVMDVLKAGVDSSAQERITELEQENAKLKKENMKLRTKLSQANDQVKLQSAELAARDKAAKEKERDILSDDGTKSPTKRRRDNSKKEKNPYIALLEGNQADTEEEPSSPHALPPIGPGKSAVTSPQPHAKRREEPKRQSVVDRKLRKDSTPVTQDPSKTTPARSPSLDPKMRSPSTKQKTEHKATNNLSDPPPDPDQTQTSDPAETRGASPAGVVIEGSLHLPVGEESLDVKIAVDLPAGLPISFSSGKP